MKKTVLFFVLFHRMALDWQASVSFASWIALAASLPWAPSTLSQDPALPQSALTASADLRAPKMRTQVPAAVSEPSLLLGSGENSAAPSRVCWEAFPEAVRPRVIFKYIEIVIVLDVVSSTNRGDPCLVDHLRPWLADMSQLGHGSVSLSCSPRLF